MKAKKPPSAEGDNTNERTKRLKVHQPLDTLGGVISELSRVYREMRNDKLDHMKGRSLAWVLGQLRAAIETRTLEQLEERLNELSSAQEARNGYPRANRPSAATH